MEVDKLSSKAKIAWGNIEMGRSLMNQGNAEDALPLLERAEKTEEVRIIARLKKASCLALLGRKEEGLALINEVLAEAPREPEAYDSKGQILQLMERLDEAGEAHKKAVELAPGNYLVWYNMACYRARIGEPGLCRDALKKAIELRPQQNVYAAQDVDFDRYKDEDWFKEIIAFK
ncbi:MAG: tetratricopeptide repeat protein [bacterium]|nr:tetratricopeptide repeat protein [bacterium]